MGQESYLLEVTRYVHLNPFRAALCRRVADYPWSSYRAYVTLTPPPLRLVDVKPILGLFGRVLSEQTQCYRQFVEGLAHEEVRLRRWLRTLERNKVIPPARWFREVPGTSPAL